VSIDSPGAKEESISKAYSDQATTPLWHQRISRRGFLRVSLAALTLSTFHLPTRFNPAQASSVSPLFWVKNIPSQPFYGGGDSNLHYGVDSLLQLMGEHDLKFYRASQLTDLSGPVGLIGPDDVVLIKVNAQWKYRGCTNSDLIRGLIQRILAHPEGFIGEVVLFENGQGRGSLKCDTQGGHYPDHDVHANANDESHSFVFLVNHIFNDPRVSYYLLDPIRNTFIGANNHATDGYRKFENISYPCFTTARGYRVELREGIWTGSDYSQNLKLINVPVLKYHDVGGSEITASLKHVYGIVSMADGQHGFRHYNGLGETCGKMMVSVRTPVLNIIDAIWVSFSSLAGYPSSTTHRANQIVASQDPVALDCWASKYVLYPISKSSRHLPTFSGVDSWLTAARDVINARGGLYRLDSGIMVDRVTKDEEEMVIHSFGGVKLLTPTAGEVIQSGSNYLISWEAISKAVTFRLSYSTDGGQTWERIADRVETTSYDWPVPAPKNSRRNCIIRVVGYDAKGNRVGADRLDAPFTIEVLRVVSPQEEDVWITGNSYDITWSTFKTVAPVTNVTIYLTKNGGTTWTSLTSLDENLGLWKWQVLSVARERKSCRIKVVLKDENGTIVGSDVSEGFFVIRPQ
jgi:hypothetical protein